MTIIKTTENSLEVFEDCQYVFNEIQVTNDPILVVSMQVSSEDKTVKNIYINKKNIIMFYPV